MPSAWLSTVAHAPSKSAVLWVPVVWPLSG